jgi:hypothetical protein
MKSNALTYFKIARIIGVLLAIVAIVLSIKSTKNENNLPQGFFTPIVALEFIQTPQEVKHFFEVKDVQQYESNLLFGNNVDYIFMTVYSCLLFVIALGIYKITSSKLMYVVMFLCVVMLLCDALENHQIAQIIFYYKTNASIEIFMSKLKVFTWLKWSAIATSFLLFTPFFLKGNWYQKAIGILGISSFLLCIAAFLKHGILNEIFALNIILVFLLLVIFVFTYKPKTIA